jgi:hypothetical protein
MFIDNGESPVLSLLIDWLIFLLASSWDGCDRATPVCIVALGRVSVSQSMLHIISKQYVLSCSSPSTFLGLGLLLT